MKKQLSRSEIEKQMKELYEVYQNDKAHQVRLTRLSVELSDAYAEEMKRQDIKVKAINDNERQQWQKERKLQFKLFDIDTTVKMITTKHLTELNEEELKVVLQRINELYDMMNSMKKKNTNEYKELNKEYLDLKSKLNEPVSFEYKNPTMNKPRPLKIDEYNFKSVSNIIKNIHYFERNDIETYNDVKQALQVVEFSNNQITAINQALDEGRIDKALSKDYELACRKVVKALNEQHVYQMEVINHFM